AGEDLDVLRHRVERHDPVPRRGVGLGAGGERGSEEDERDEARAAKGSEPHGVTSHPAHGIYRSSTRPRGPWTIAISAAAGPGFTASGSPSSRSWPCTRDASGCSALKAIS